MEGAVSESTRYVVPGIGRVEQKELVALTGADEGRRFPFWERLTIGRLDPAAPPEPAVLYLDDPAVSSTHCVVTQDSWGHCYARDLSLNGTRIDHRRIVPGADTEWRIGQILSVGLDHEFALRGEVASPRASQPGGTLFTGQPVEVTVLVGDVRSFTALVQSTPPGLLQESVTAVIEELGELVGACEGTVKEYPGDAVLAYWESSLSCSCAVRACGAVFALDAAVPRLAWDPSIWKLPPELLRMDWALATGTVTIARIGGAHPVGLSVVGEPIVKAFRMEKLAGAQTGPIIACRRTHILAQGEVCFRALGEMPIEGFWHPEEVFAVMGMR